MIFHDDLCDREIDFMYGFQGNFVVETLRISCFGWVLKIVPSSNSGTLTRCGNFQLANMLRTLKRPENSWDVSEVECQVIG